MELTLEACTCTIFSAPVVATLSNKTDHNIQVAEQTSDGCPISFCVFRDGREIPFIGMLTRHNKPEYKTLHHGEKKVYKLNLSEWHGMMQYNLDRVGLYKIQAIYHMKEHTILSNTLVIYIGLLDDTL